ncbi:MAG: sigma-70 family RNA polymerase sigma factor [Bacteroidota bacterium]
MFRKKSKYDEQALIAAIKKGGLDRQRAAQTLFDAHQGLVYKGKQKYRIEEEAATDLYADAVVSMLRQIENNRFKGDSSLFTFLFRIFSNRCLNFVRDQKRQAVQWADELPDYPDLARNALQELISSESLARLKSYMQQLGDKCREILWDSLYHGFSSEELAQRMNYKDAASVYTVKYRCLKKLTNLIGG